MPALCRALALGQQAETLPDKSTLSAAACYQGSTARAECTAGELVVVSPDVGGVARARAFAKKLSDAPLAIVDKRRSAHNVSEVMNLIGDVRGKVAVLVDDMIDTAGTITNAAKVLHNEGAKAVYACATHAVFSPPAVERLSSGTLSWLCPAAPPVRLSAAGCVSDAHEPAARALLQGAVAGCTPHACPASGDGAASVAAVSRDRTCRGLQ